MRKKGFTLAEVVITIGIVGIAAALLAPAIGNTIPDKNKTSVVNLHQKLATITESLLSNEGIYYGYGEIIKNGQLYTNTCQGLALQEQPLISPYNSATYSGVSKYARLLADNLEASSIGGSGSTINFTTDDKVKWTVESATSGYSNITVDLNGDKGNNCSYSADCKKPDQFIFKVDNMGKISPGDALTEAYLKNPLNLNDKKEDMRAASTTTTVFSNSLPAKTCGTTTESMSSGD